MTLAAAAHYLSNQPTGGALVFLIVAAVLFAVATVVAIMEKAWTAALLTGGLVAVVLAFAVK